MLKEWLLYGFHERKAQNETPIENKRSKKGKKNLGLTTGMDPTLPDTLTAEDE